MSLSKRLVSLKLEGKIVLSLISGFWGLSDYPKRFSEIKRILNVSDPGLYKALQRIKAEGIMERNEQRRYHVKPEFRDQAGKLLRPLYNEYLLERARLIAESLRQLEGVMLIIVFGSVAQGKADFDSDIDMLVVVNEWKESSERRIHETISRLAVEMGIPVEAIVISATSIKALLEHEFQFLFGLLEGYIILYDKANVAKLLHAKEQEIKGKYEYHEDVPLWLPRMK